MGHDDYPGDYPGQPGDPGYPGEWGHPRESGDPERGFELIRPEDFLRPDPVPSDARRMGLDRNTEEGAMLTFASSLDPAKGSHRLVAWVLLLVMLIPVLLGVVSELRLL
jgi:hypothetical protein